MEPVEERIKKQTELATMFTDRDKQYDRATSRIFKHVPNVLDALRTLFALHEDQIEWSDLNVIDDALVIQVTITYTPGTTSPFIQMFTPKNMVPEDVEYVEQLVRVGIPMHMAFAPVEDIIEFLRAIAKVSPREDSATPATPATPTAAFNVDQLTPEQQQQLLLLQLHGHPTSKH